MKSCVREITHAKINRANFTATCSWLLSRIDSTWDKNRFYHSLDLSIEIHDNLFLIRRKSLTIDTDQNVLFEWGNSHPNTISFGERESFLLSAYLRNWCQYRVIFTRVHLALKCILQKYCFIWMTLIGSHLWTEAKWSQNVMSVPNGCFVLFLLFLCHIAKTRGKIGKICRLRPLRQAFARSKTTGRRNVEKDAWVYSIASMVEF